MLDTRDIIILTASFYLGGVVGEFFKSLSEDILTPLLAPAAAAGKGVSSYTVSAGGVTLKLGEVLVAFVNLWSRLCWSSSRLASSAPTF
jgi:large-conductance mechanosensitive channel